MVRYRKKLVSLPIRLRNQKWDTYHLSGTQLWLDRASSFAPNPVPKAAKPGLGKSHLSVQRFSAVHVEWVRAAALSPEEHRARPAATVPAQANRRKKRRSRQPRGRRLLRALRAGTNRPPPNSHPSTHGRDAPGDAIDRGHTQGAGWGRGWAGGREVGEMGSRDPGAQWCAKTSSSQSGCLGIYNLESENLPHL